MSSYNSKLVYDKLSKKLSSVRIIDYLLNMLGLFLFFSGWHYAVNFGFINEKYLPPPLVILATFINKFSNAEPDGGTLIAHIIASFSVAFTGFIIAVIVGIPLGLAMGWYKPVDRFIRPIFELIRPISPIAWIPLTILWLGIGLRAKTFVVFLSAFVPCVINSYTGIGLTNQGLINVAKTFGATSFETLVKVGIPSALPLILAGVRISLNNAWATLVGAELLASNVGLGYMIMQGRQFSRPDIIIVGMFTIGILGVIMSFVLSEIEIRLIKWR